MNSHKNICLKMLERKHKIIEQNETTGLFLHWVPDINVHLHNVKLGTEVLIATDVGDNQTH